MKKVFMFFLVVALVVTMIPFGMVSAEENYIYRTVFDAETTNGTNYKSASGMKAAIVDSTLSGGTKVLKATRTATYNGCCVKVTDDFRSYAKDAIGIRFWASGDSIAIDNARNFSLAFGVGNVLYKIDGEHKNSFVPTLDGQVYTVMFNSDTSLYNTNTNFNAVYSSQKWSSVLGDYGLGKISAIYFGCDTYSDNTTQSYYIDDVELIFPENTVYSPLEYKASFASTKTATLSVPIDEIAADCNNSDSLVLPSALLNEGEFGGWALSTAPTTVIPAGTTVKITSDTTYYAVLKNKPKMSTPVAPTENSVSGNIISLVSMGTDYMYKMDDGDWQSSTTFSGLNADTKYTFYAKRLADIAYSDSDSSLGTEIYTTNELCFSASTTLVSSSGCSLGNYPTTDGSVTTTYKQFNSPTDTCTFKFRFKDLKTGYYKIIVESRNVKDSRSAFTMVANDETGEQQDLGIMDFADLTHKVSGSTYHCKTPIDTTVVIKKGSTLELSYTMQTKRTTGAQISQFIIEEVVPEKTVNIGEKPVNIKTAMVRGGSMRFPKVDGDDSVTGIRFLAKYNTADIQAILDAGYEITDYGTTFSYNGSNTVGDKLVQTHAIDFYKIEDGYSYVAGSMVGIKEDHITGTFSGIGYLEFTSKTNENDKITLNSIANDNDRSIAYIAYAFVNDASSDFAAIEDLELKNKIQGYANQYTPA